MMGNANVEPNRQQLLRKLLWRARRRLPRSFSPNPPMVRLTQVGEV